MYHPTTFFLAVHTVSVGPGSVLSCPGCPFNLHILRFTRTVYRHRKKVESRRFCGHFFFHFGLLVFAVYCLGKFSAVNNCEYVSECRVSVATTDRTWLMSCFSCFATDQKALRMNEETSCQLLPHTHTHTHSCTHTYTSTHCIIAKFELHIEMTCQFVSQSESHFVEFAELTSNRSK